MKAKEPVNPLYVLCAIVGVLFTVTACAYGLLMVRANRAATGEIASPQHSLMNLLDRHGVLILGVEVAVVAVCAIGAIVLDHYRGKRAGREKSSHPTP